MIIPPAVQDLPLGKLLLGGGAGLCQRCVAQQFGCLSFHGIFFRTIKRIGWGYGDTRVMPLDDYEERKSYRRRPIVLTRSEREEILLNWGISFDDIIDSIRMNIRVKNQRRQTVTNLGKIEKLEEAFESATRKIKRALLLRRRTGEKVKRLQEQAEVAKKVHSPSSSVEEELKADQIYREDSQANGEAGEEERRNQISLPDFRKKGPPEMKLARSTSSLSDVDELHTSISGFSLGNSTTASAREMERFYRELEMEMFGDMPLPDMVGETLEVPGLTIPEEERVYHDPPFSLSHQEPPSVAPSYAAMLDESKEYQEVDPPPRASQLLHRPEMKLYFQPNPPPWFQTDSDMRGRGNDPALNHALEDGADGHIAPIRHIVSPQRDKEAEVLSAQMPTPPAGLIFYDDPIMAIRMGHVPPPHVRLRSSLDSVDMEKLEQHRSNMARAYLSQTVTAMEQRYLHPSLAPPVPPTNQFGMAYYPEENTRGFHPGGGLPSVVEQDENSSATSSTGRSKRSKRRKDGPEIRHTPPFLRKSPTHWMEGHDEAEDGPGMYSPYCDPITISEDEASEDRIRPSYQRPLEPQPVFIAPQHFLDTYYG